MARQENLVHWRNAALTAQAMLLKTEHERDQAYKVLRIWLQFWGADSQTLEPELADEAMKQTLKLIGGK